jgi:DNA-binding response OmpR family regulator
MSSVNILIADNDADALSIYGEFLHSLGYNIFKASSAVEARKIIKTERLHLVIFDLRLTDDSPSDKSGLLLAQEVARSTPKLILTKWPLHQDVRVALKLDEHPLPPAVDFLDKKEGLAPLGDAVKQALSKYVRINQDLVIQSSDAHSVTFPGLFELLSSESQALIHGGAEEIEDLFRKLFYEKSQITIDRLLWNHDGRVVLVVFTFADGNTPESFVVVCGPTEKMEQDEQRYRDFAPSAPGHTATMLNKVVSTPHFAAHAYVLAGAGGEERVPLDEFYRTAPDRLFRAALSNLFDETLSEWHQEKFLPSEGHSIAELYTTILGLSGKDHLIKLLEQRFEAIVRQLPVLGADVQRKHGKLTVSFGGEKITYADPISRITSLYDEQGTSLLIKTPVRLLASNILVDEKAHAWLTDFGSAGFGPLLCNHVALESVLRFDCAEAKKLAWLHEMELLLSGPEFVKLYATEVESPLRKTVRAVQNVRRLGARWVGKAQRAYLIGILFQAISRLIEYRPELKLTNHELIKLGHLLLATTIICEKVTKKSSVNTENRGIQIDHTNRSVRINGVKVQIRGQSYDLLRELYLHGNELCSRVAIVERVFNEKYEELNESQMNRLNTAIRRLREKIEEDPNHPRFLLTEPQGGYRLVLN